MTAIIRVCLTYEQNNLIFALNKLQFAPSWCESSNQIAEHSRSCCSRWNFKSEKLPLIIIITTKIKKQIGLLMFFFYRNNKGKTFFLYVSVLKQVC